MTLFRPSFEHICNKRECDQLLEWDYDYTYQGHEAFESTMECVSCMKMGESTNVDDFPPDCPHTEEMKVSLQMQYASHLDEVKKSEQEQILRKLKYEPS